MSSFDPIAAATDWLDAYRAASLSIVDLYDDSASLECSCGGYKVIVGKSAIAEYWRHRFVGKPAGELEDMYALGSAIVVHYRGPNGTVQAILNFNEAGKVERSRCGPSSVEVIKLGARRAPP
jgi:hypothetical protein